MNRSQGDSPSGPKPYFFVQLRKDRKPKRVNPITHERFDHFSGHMGLDIVVHSNFLFVGSGQLDLFSIDSKEQVRYAFARRQNQLILPGTGLKGAVRALYEALTNSCLKLAKREEKYPFNYKFCKDIEQLCPACRLFGTTGYQGRVHFTDAVSIVKIQTKTIKIAELWPPRRTRGRKFYGSGAFQKSTDMRPQKNHRYLEVVPRGARFRTTLYFNNASGAELGVLMRAMGFDLDPSDETKVIIACPIKIGGAKPRCLGSVRFQIQSLRLMKIEREHIFQSLSKRTTGSGKTSQPEERVIEWLNNRTLLDTKTWDSIKKNLKDTQDKICPPEVY